MSCEHLLPIVYGVEAMNPGCDLPLAPSMRRPGLAARIRLQHAPIWQAVRHLDCGLPSQQAERESSMPGFPPRVIVCVGAVVLHGQEVLLVRQTYGALKGMWSLPWGFLHGEDPKDLADPPQVAALRETLEEGGIHAEIEGLLGIQNHARQESLEPCVYLLFLCRHVGGEPTPDGRETDRAAYFSLAQLDALDEPVDEFCEWLARRVLRGEYQLIPPEPANPYQPHLAFL